jgi:hypothetical protein
MRKKINSIDLNSINLKFFSGGNHSDPQQYQCCSGFYIDIFNVLKDRLKFEFELYQVLDRTWGARNQLTVINLLFLSF